MRKFELNESYFDIIDSPEKAYILGFLYADRHMSKSLYFISINIASQDIEILDFIKKSLNFTGGIKILPPSIIKETGNYRKEQARININSKKLCASLLKQGMYPNKSLILLPPNIEPQFKKDFILGYFDGDGCIATSTLNNPLFSIRGTHEVMTYIRDEIVNQIDLSCTKLYHDNKDPNKNNYKLVWGGSGVCVKLREYLYSNSPFYLKRKKEKFDTITFDSLNTKRMGKYRIKITQLTLNGEFIRDWVSINKAQEAYGSGLIHALNRKDAIYKGYKWAKFPD